MTFHVISLPHTQTTLEYDHCAYTSKVRKFCNMMYGLGHTVYLYSSDDNEARCTEHINVIPREHQYQMFGAQEKEEFFNITWGPRDYHWRYMNTSAIAAIKERIQPKDFICVIAGYCQKEIADAFPEHMTVEYGVGYEGVFSNYKVFESYAWMHTVYGSLHGAMGANGHYWDTVIPNYYETDLYPLQTEKGDYFMYLGRLIDRKGWRIAQEVCERLGKRLIVAGQGEFSGYGEYVGVVDPGQRAELLGGAKALFVPTQYIGPFEGVHAEALLCGTPVITTDFGVFTETVKNAVNGFRCSSFSDFIEAAEVCSTNHFDPKEISHDAHLRYSTSRVAYLYQNYFEHLMTLWGNGWYQVPETV